MSTSYCTYRTLPTTPITMQADVMNNAIRSIDLIASNSVTTVAGSPTQASGHADASGTAASFYYPTGVALAGTRALVVSNSQHYWVCVWPGLVGGTIRHCIRLGMLARCHTNRSSSPLLQADYYNCVIRSIDLTTNTLTTLAGSGTAGHADGVGAAARFLLPTGIAHNSAGTRALVVSEPSLIYSRGNACQCSGSESEEL